MIVLKKKYNQYNCTFLNNILTIKSVKKIKIVKIKLKISDTKDFNSDRIEAEINSKFISDYYSNSTLENIKLQILQSLHKRGFIFSHLNYFDFKNNELFVSVSIGIIDKIVLHGTKSQQFFSYERCNF